MDTEILSMFLLGLYTIGLVMEWFLIKALAKKNPEKLQKIRWPMVMSYIFPGVLFGIGEVLPIEQLLLPWLICIAGGTTSYYLHFIHNRQSVSSPENPYKGFGN